MHDDNDDDDAYIPEMKGSEDGDSIGDNNNTFTQQLLGRNNLERNDANIETSLNRIVMLRLFPFGIAKAMLHYIMLLQLYQYF